MQYRSHRGGTHYTPENTMPAFLYAVNAGYDYIETDPQLTRDGVVVLMHDDTINRTCRHADGSRIETPVRVDEHTYEELLQYDAGIAFGEQFRGTKVPRLDELLSLAEGRGITISLDKKIKTEQIDALIDVVLAHKVRVAFSTSSIERIKKIQARMPDAAFDFDVNTEDEVLCEACRLVKPENLIVWLYLDKPNFSWLAAKAKTAPENIARVRKYARLGIANVNNAIDVKEALEMCPDILEV